MNDREVIEQMAKIMCGHDCEECAKETADWRGVSLEKAKAEQCLIKKQAELLYNAGCRIILEDSVVLTNDEWARLRNLEINYNDAYEAYRKYAIQNKGLREENGQLRLENNDLEGENEKLKNYNDKLSQGIYFGNGEQFCNRLEQARKETAEKIFAKIDKELCECTIVHNGGDYGWNLQGYERNDLTERLTKIAEQFGTSIEEYKKAAYRDHLLLENYYGHAKEQTEKVQAAQKGEK